MNELTKEQRDLINNLDELINRTKAINQVVENNLIEECTSYQTISDRVASNLCFQVTANLEQIEELVGRLYHTGMSTAENAAGVVERGGQVG